MPNGAQLIDPVTTQDVRRLYSNLHKYIPTVSATHKDITTAKQALNAGIAAINFVSSTAKFFKDTPLTRVFDKNSYAGFNAGMTMLGTGAVGASLGMDTTISNLLTNNALTHSLINHISPYFPDFSPTSMAVGMGLAMVWKARHPTTAAEACIVGRQFAAGPITLAIGIRDAIANKNFNILDTSKALDQAINSKPAKIDDQVTVHQVYMALASNKAMYEPNVTGGDKIGTVSTSIDKVPITRTLINKCDQYLSADQSSLILAKLNAKSITDTQYKNLTSISKSPHKITYNNENKLWELHVKGNNPYYLNTYMAAQLVADTMPYPSAIDPTQRIAINFPETTRNTITDIVTHNKELQQELKEYNIPALNLKSNSISLS